MAVIKTKYEQSKVYDKPLVQTIGSVQDIFSLEGIEESGIFILPSDRYSKTYKLSDINFAGVTDEEQKGIIISFSKVLKGIPCRFSYTVANEHVDEKSFNEKILYKKRKDEDDDLRESYNRVIKEKLSDAKQGLYQTIYLTLTINADDIKDARGQFMSIEGAIKSAFIGLGLNGMQGSSMKALSIDERMQLLYNFMNAGLDSKNKFSFQNMVASGQDFINILSPAAITFSQDSFILNGSYGKVMYVDQYPKSLESDILTSLSKINCTSYVTVKNELLDVSAFKQEISRKYMAVGMKIESEKQRNRNHNDFLADASQKLLSEKEKLDSFMKEMDELDDHYFNTTILVLFMADSKEELVQIEEKLKNIASLKSLTLKPCFGRQKEALNSSLSEVLSNEEQIRSYSPTLQDVYQGLLDEGTDLSEHLAAAMEIFVNGSLSLFNHRTNVDLSNRLIAFDIAGLKDNLRITSMLIMMETLRNKIKVNARAGRWTHLYIDEFHELLGVEQVANFVLKLWKEIRKMSGILTGITQNMSDLLNDDNGKLSAILSNTEYFALLSQSSVDKRKLMEFLPSISPAMFNFVDGAESGTGLLKMGSVTVPFDMRMSKESEVYKIVNTDGGGYGV